MKTRVYLFVLPAIVLAVLLSAFKDDDWLTSLLEKLDAYRNQYPQEKVHLHTDKPYYSIGDDIWLKAYVVNSENHELSTLSKVLYIDLINDADSVHKTIVLPLVNGLGSGSLQLTDSIASPGNYHLRAYTRWMQNFSTDFFFNKNVVIGDARTPTAMQASAKFNINNNQLTADVTYLSLTGNSPLAGKPVSYQLFNGTKVFAAGKGTTLGDGKFAVTTPLPAGYKANDIRLETTVTVAAFTDVKRSFKFNNGSSKVDLQFFPEGGWLVMGLRSKVGFKAITADYKSVNINGTIVDEQGKQITAFDTQHAGMGVFVLQPKVGSTYTAIIKDDRGNDARYPLPSALSEGCVLAVNHTGKDSLTIGVAASPELRQKEYAIVAQQNGIVRYAGKINTNRGIVSTRLPEKRFNTGIVQFTLLTAEGKPLAERLSFINHHDQLSVKVNTNKTQYKAREKVEMIINATDDAGEPQQANFSVSVIDESKVNISEGTDISIEADLLLTSDLKGYIENPNYYFIEENAQKVQHLDNLLLTQGWRRFNWTDVNNNNLTPAAIRAQKSLDISGTITTLSNKPVAFGKITLFANTPQGPLLLDTIADKDGKFYIDQLDLSGDAIVTIKATNAKDKDNVKIILDKPALPIFEHYVGFENGLTTLSVINYLNNTQKRFDQLDNGILNKIVMLKQVDVKDTRVNRKKRVQGSHKNITGDADLVLNYEDMKWRQNVLQSLYGKAGIEIRGPYVYMIRGPRSMMGPRRPMEIRVNGSPVDAGFLQNLSPFDVEGIELIMSSFNLVTYGEGGSSGVIEVTLRNEFSAPRKSPLIFNVNQQLVNGYAPSREFYSPVYDASQTNNKAVDLRSTIYWNPNIVTDESGAANLTYYTADEPGNYRVTVEGIDIDGRLARQVYRFTVK